MSEENENPPKTLRPSPDALLDPKCDTTFKALFTDNSDDARLALKSFLEAVLNAKVTNIQLRPNEEAIESLTDKDSVFDITCTLNGSEAVEIEMQNRNDDADYDKRAEYYAAHLLNHYTDKGTVWANTPKVFQISVLNFVYDGSTTENISVYNMRTENNRRLSDRMTVVFLELPKIKELPNDIDSLTSAEKWCKFFLYADDKSMEDFIRKLCESEEGIMAAQATLARISRDEANWILQKSREKAEKDARSRIYNAEQRGLQQGAHNKALETARKMLSEEISTDIIARCTGLPLTEVTALQSEMSATASA